MSLTEMEREFLETVRDMEHRHQEREELLTAKLDNLTQQVTDLSMNLESFRRACELLSTLWKEDA